MPRPKGLPKTGGRQKGSRNKHLRAAPEIFEQLSFNSLEVAISLINNESVDIQYRVGLLKEVMKYQFPQLRSVEQTGEGGHQVVLQETHQQLVQIFTDPDMLQSAQRLAEKMVEK